MGNQRSWRRQILHQKCLSLWCWEKMQQETIDNKKQIHGFTLLGTNISHPKALLKIIFLFPRWDMLVPWRVFPIRMENTISRYNLSSSHVIYIYIQVWCLQFTSERWKNMMTFGTSPRMKLLRYRSWYRMTCPSRLENPPFFWIKLPFLVGKDSPQKKSFLQYQ